MELKILAAPQSIRFYGADDISKLNQLSRIQNTPTRGMPIGACASNELHAG
jgi:hypothetical protein